MGVFEPGLLDKVDLPAGSISSIGGQPSFAGLGHTLDAIFKSVWHYWLESHGPGGK